MRIFICALLSYVLLLPTWAEAKLHFEIVQNRDVSERAASDLNKLEEFFNKEAVPQIEKQLCVEIPFVTVLLGDLNDKLHYSGFFDANLSPDLISIDIFYDGTNRVLPMLEISKNIMHELQHAFLWKKQKNADWALNELLSLMWQELFLQAANETDIRAARRAKGYFWNFNRDDRATYGRLNLIARAMIRDFGSTFLADFYQNPSSSLDEWFVRLGLTRNDIENRTK